MSKEHDFEIGVDKGYCSMVKLVIQPYDQTLAVFIEYDQT